MSGMVNDMIVLSMVVGPFVAMPLLWRRMKRVQAQTNEQFETPSHGLDWEEALETEDGMTLARSHQPNNDLIALGEKGRHGHWPLSSG